MPTVTHRGSFGSNTELVLACVGRSEKNGYIVRFLAHLETSQCELKADWDYSQLTTGLFLI